ncbi:hypothetical protein Nmel_008997 [Mimus melanotis]
MILPGLDTKVGVTDVTAWRQLCQLVAKTQIPNSGDREAFGYPCRDQAGSGNAILMATAVRKSSKFGNGESEMLKSISSLDTLEPFSNICPRGDRSNSVNGENTTDHVLDTTKEKYPRHILSLQRSSQLLPLPNACTQPPPQRGSSEGPFNTRTRPLLTRPAGSSRGRKGGTRRRPQCGPPAMAAARPVRARALLQQSVSARLQVRPPERGSEAQWVEVM